MKPFRRRLLSVAGGAAALVALTGTTACTTGPPDTYVALGDSYVAGPLIPDMVGPLGCLRSNKDYPQLVKPQIKVKQIVDVSCSGAETQDMFATQNVTPGPNPAQLNSLSTMTKVVTVGIGGNDIGFSNIVKDCLQLDPGSAGCKPRFVTASGDKLSQNIAATAPDVRKVIDAIKARAPRAAVFVVGYPSLLPNTGTGCWPAVPMLPNDVPYLRDKTKELNAMLKAQATAAGVHYVDVYTASIGHDMCTPNGTRWVEGIIPATSAAPVHPNALGMRNIANVVAARINQVVTT